MGGFLWFSINNNPKNGAHSKEKTHTHTHTMNMIKHRKRGWLRLECRKKGIEPCGGTTGTWPVFWPYFGTVPSQHLKKNTARCNYHLRLACSPPRLHRNILLKQQLGADDTLWMDKLQQGAMNIEIQQQLQDLSTPYHEDRLLKKTSYVCQWLPIGAPPIE